MRPGVSRRVDTANLTGAHLERAVLVRADLTGADLSGADGLTQAQIDRAFGEPITRLVKFNYRGICSP